MRQSHGFISRARSELLEHAPDLWHGLLDAGAIELRLLDGRRQTLEGFEALTTDDELAFLLCRRTTFEWVLRRTAERECDVRLGTRVTGLLTDGSGARPRATGVATSEGMIAADLVVDASGRSGGLAHRRRDAGDPVAGISDEPCHIVYATRFYRLRSGAGWGPLNRMWAAGGTFAGYACVLIPHDDNTFSINFGRLPEDHELSPGHTADGFTRAMSHIPNVSEWVDPGRAEPTGPPVPMAGIHNMLAPATEVTGLFGIGDAVCTTDPAFGRGAALAVASAFALADAVGDSGGDLTSAGEHFDSWFSANVAPWHADAVATDRGRTAMWHAALAASGSPATAGPPRPDPSPASPAESAPPVPASLVVAAGTWGPDPAVCRAFIRYAALLAPPQSLMTTQVTDRVRRMAAEGWAPPDAGAPTHRELVEIVNG